ncbi:uncharacterized protein [Amphiura filiformis]|uniref:uncharacterized protein n=1 Tax=Amphiura filiformis TaxID=82378 RepID=UPI003B21B43F
MDTMHNNSRQTGLVRLLLLICLLIALVHPVYSDRHCQNMLPKFCFVHPGKRNSQGTKAIDRNQIGEAGLEQGTMQLSNSDSSPSLSKMEAIIALLMGPLNNDEETQTEDYQEEDTNSLTRTQQDKILTRLLLLSRKDTS